MRLARYGIASPIYLGALGPGCIDSGSSHGCILSAMDLWISTLHATMWYRPAIHSPPIQDDSRSNKYGVFCTSLPSRQPARSYPAKHHHPLAHLAGPPCSPCSDPFTSWQQSLVRSDLDTASGSLQPCAAVGVAHCHTLSSRSDRPHRSDQCGGACRTLQANAHVYLASNPREDPSSYSLVPWPVIETVTGRGSCSHRICRLCSSWSSTLRMTGMCPLGHGPSFRCRHPSDAGVWTVHLYRPQHSATRGKRGWISLNISLQGFGVKISLSCHITAYCTLSRHVR